MAIVRWDRNLDGPLTERTLRRKLERRGYEVSRYVDPPGTYFPDHTHGVDKVDAVPSGRFRITLAGDAVILEAGDAVRRGQVSSLIPSPVWHPGRLAKRARAEEL